MQRSLPVFIDGALVAVLAEPRTNKFTLAYEAAATPPVPPISARLPWSVDRYPPAMVAPWIDSLVPPEPVRQDLAAALGVREHLLFRFLEAQGADLPGAVVLGETEPTPEGAQALRPDELFDETPVVASAGAWARPGDGAPSSHIARFEDELLPGSVAAEAFALALADAAGIDTVAAQRVDLHDHPTLVVQRADRTVGHDGSIGRRHLETFGSLCGVALEGDDDRIYEERGGPSFDDMAEALNTFSNDPQGEIRSLVDHMVLHLCLGNTNAHANSYTLLLPQRTLGPVQTLLPAEIYTELITEDGTFDVDHRLAMTIGDTPISADVTRGALIAEAAGWPRLGRAAAETRVDDVLERISAAVEVAIATVPDVPDRLPSLVLARLGHLMQ